MNSVALCYSGPAGSEPAPTLSVCFRIKKFVECYVTHKVQEQFSGLSNLTPGNLNYGKLENILTLTGKFDER